MYISSAAQEPWDVYGKPDKGEIVNKYGQTGAVDRSVGR
jgi:hypothetical protein